jgi:hypothetical protein
VFSNKLSQTKIQAIYDHKGIIKHYARKTYGGVNVQIHVFLTSAVVTGEWSAAINPGKSPGNYWIRGWVNPEPVWTTCRRENS